jgi:hypothetical protein
LCRKKNAVSSITTKQIYSTFTTENSELDYTNINVTLKVSSQVTLSVALLATDVPPTAEHLAQQKKEKVTAI